MVYSLGDLTDSKSQNQRKSGQYEEEWIIYRKVLNEANISEKVLWLDIRGNHGEKMFSITHHINTYLINFHLSWKLYWSGNQKINQIYLILA